jgi:ATP-dependent RNA helicase DBP3
VPLLIHTLRKENRKTMKISLPYYLFLSPTRELAQQIADVLADAGESCGVECVFLYDNTSKGQHISAMKSGVDIVVATPGHLKDLMYSGFYNLSEDSLMVLDEADQMLFLEPLLAVGTLPLLSDCLKVAMLFVMGNV